MASPMGSSKRRFGDTTFLDDGAPTSPSDLYIYRRGLPTNYYIPKSDGTSPTIAAWALTTVRRSAAAVATSSAWAARTIFKPAVDFAQTRLYAPPRAPIISPTNGSKRRSVQVPSRVHVRTSPGVLRRISPTGSRRGSSLRYTDRRGREWYNTREKVYGNGAPLDRAPHAHGSLRALYADDFEGSMMPDFEKPEAEQHMASPSAPSQVLQAGAIAVQPIDPRDDIVAGKLRGFPRDARPRPSSSSRDSSSGDEGDYSYFKEAAAKEERERKSRILGLSVEDRWLEARAQERKQEQMDWKTQFVHMRQQLVAEQGKVATLKAELDADRAKLAELDKLAKLAGTTVEDLILSSPLTGSKLAAAETAAETSVEKDEVAVPADGKVKATKEAPATDGNRSAAPRVEFDLTSPEPEAKAVPKKQAKAEEPAVSDTRPDPWFSNVDVADITDKVASAKIAEPAAPVPPPKLIIPLSDDWVTKTQTALATRPNSTKLVSERSDITPAALSTLVGKNWLNDAVINEYVQHVVARQQQEASASAAPTTNRNGAPASAASTTPAHLALNSNWWNTINSPHNTVEDGLNKVLRWAKRAKIDGTKLLSVSDLYIPVNAQSHWTLIAISGTRRTVEYLNSLDGCGPSDEKVFAITRRYLAKHLGAAYDADAWTEVRSRSAQQVGGFDCGAFVCFNALALAKGLVPGEAFGSADIGIGRQRISATLLNSGFSGDMDW